jgi:hypothetical protein
MKRFLFMVFFLTLLLGCGGPKPTEPVLVLDVVPDRNFDEAAEAKASEQVKKLGGQTTRFKPTDAITDLQFRNVPLKDDDLELLNAFPHLSWLIVQDCPGFRGIGLKHLAQTPKLKFLTLAGRDVQGSALAQLANTPKLRNLTLARLSVTPAEFQPLVRLKELQTLELVKTDITEEHLKHLEQMPELMELYLKDTGLTREAAEAFALRVNAKRPIEKPKLEVVFLP